MRSVLAAFALLIAEAAQARPITLTCRDSENLYDRPYAVLVDSRNLMLQINRTTGPFAGRRAYPIEQVETDNGGFIVTARGRMLNSAIKVAATTGERWIEYTEAFTDRPFAIDYCR